MNAQIVDMFFNVVDKNAMFLVFALLIKSIPDTKDKPKPVNLNYLIVTRKDAMFRRKTCIIRVA